jgi:hypothetical protein
MVYLQWPDFEGNAHVPFSSFPGFLVWAPLSPYFALTDLKIDSGEPIGALATFLSVFIATFFVLRRTHR